ncbi:MAG TPA: hypothetical protein DCK93_00685, partial [Blastocatellia bacterium]|nr:hypothetical protein [Blastocatellia bacterium]
MNSKLSFASFLATFLLLATICMFRCGDVLAQANLPHFKDYPASEMYKGATAPLVLTRADQTFKTRLRWAAKNQKPNFAGHYILTSWGCGAECVMGAVIDARTGKAYW